MTLAMVSCEDILLSKALYFLKPIELLPPEWLDRLPAIGPADNRADCQQDNIQ